MPYLDDIRQRRESLTGEVDKIKQPLDKSIDPCPIPPPDNQEKVAQYVTDIFLDGVKFRKEYYQATEHIRSSNPGSMKFSFETWQKHCESLAHGNDFMVWGKRAEDWMQERVDGDIPRNMRIRKDHITANWHEIELNPNIEGVGDVFEEERKKMGWKDWIEDYVGIAQTYGYAINEIVIDYTLHPEGQIRNIARSPVQVSRTPESMSFAKGDGCTYVVVYDSINDKQIKEQFPDLDFEGLQTSWELDQDRFSKQKKSKGDYKHTKFYPKLRAFIDDQEIEDIPFTPEEQEELIDELKRLLDGEIIEARKEQNHIEHINQKMEAVDNLLSVEPENEEDSYLAQAIADAHIQNIEQHVQFATEDDVSANGKRLKYPNGRYVCVIGNKVVHDKPNPYDVPWRMLFREVQNERVTGRIDGQGDPEIMLRQAYQLDMQLSRIEDLSILQMPQNYRPLTDKNISGEDVNDNNPRRIRYTTGVIQTVQGDSPTAQLELYKIAKENIEKDRGVNPVSYGTELPSGTSGKLASLLQSQNQSVITGELDRNLREAIEDIIEGDFEVMKVIYNQEREYIVHGKVKKINVAMMLKVHLVKDKQTGMAMEEELPKIEVTVKPGSNYPNRWERRLQFFLEMSAFKDAMNLPLIPPEAIYDQLAIQYPEFAEGGKYRRINEATAIGMQVLQAEQAMAEAEAKQGNAIQSASKKFDQENLKPQMIGAGNGKTQ